MAGFYFEMANDQFCLLFLFFGLAYSSHDSKVGVFNPYTSFRFSPVEGLVSVNPSATVPSVITHLLLIWHAPVGLRLGAYEKN